MTVLAHFADDVVRIALPEKVFPVELLGSELKGGDLLAGAQLLAADEKLASIQTWAVLEIKSHKPSLRH